MMFMGKSRQTEGSMPLSKCLSGAYQAFEEPLPPSHDSVASASNRAVTARERSYDHRLSQKSLEILQGSGETKWHWAEGLPNYGIPAVAVESRHAEGPPHSIPAVEKSKAECRHHAIVGQAVLPAKPAWRAFFSPSITRNLLLTALTATMLLITGCNQNKRKVIAVIPKGTSHLFWVSVQAGALSAGKEFNVDIEWNGPAAETDYTRQIQIVDSCIARHVDGIVLAAGEKKALVAPMERAVAAGIPVTVFDSGLESDKYMTFLATNNYEAGKMAATTLAKLLNDKGKIAMVAHEPGSQSTMDRERGFEDSIKQSFPGMQIVATQFGHSDRSKAMGATENILTAHPELDGIFASSEPSSVGASLALKSRKLNGKVKLVAFDSSDGMIEDLQAGVIDAMVVQDPFRMGHDAVKTIIDKWTGNPPPKRIDLSARVVTKADLDKPEIKALLHPDVEQYLKK